MEMLATMLTSTRVIKGPAKAADQIDDRVEQAHRLPDRRQHTDRIERSAQERQGVITNNGTIWSFSNPSAQIPIINPNSENVIDVRTRKPNIANGCATSSGTKETRCR